MEKRALFINFGFGAGVLSLLMIFSGNSSEVSALLLCAGVAALAFYFNDKTELQRSRERILNLEKLAGYSRVRRDKILSTAADNRPTAKP